MPDKDKVIKGLELCAERYCDSDCPYYRRSPTIGGTCTKELLADALALLKEHEAVKPISPTNKSDLWRCGNCNHQLFRCTQQRYCENCGRKVKWE